MEAKPSVESPNLGQKRESSSVSISFEVLVKEEISADTNIRSVKMEDQFEILQRFDEAIKRYNEN